MNIWTMLDLKRGLLCMLLFLGTLNLYSQGATVQGVIIDAAGIPASYATVALLQDSLVIRGVTADSLGRFELKNVAEGSYLLGFQYVGSVPFQEPLTLTYNTTKNVTYQFKELATEIQTVVVSAKLPVIRREIDRFVVNMSNSTIVKNKNALQSLNYAPGVIITGSKEITLNGNKGVVIMLNGKKMNMSSNEVNSFLQGLRGDDIERVEVISNPGAQYDAQGQGGIIDIYLKRSAIMGFSGNIYGELIQAHNTSGSAGTRLNYNIKNVTLYGSYNYKNEKDYSSYDEKMSYPLSSSKKDSYSRYKSSTIYHTYRGGIQYTPNKTHTLGIEAYGSIRDKDGDNYASIHVITPIADSMLWQQGDADSKNSNNSYSLNYSFKPGRKRQELTLLVDYSVANRDIHGLQGYTTNTTNSPPDDRQHTDRDYSIISSRVDYRHPIGSNMRISVGGKMYHSKNTIKENSEENDGTQWSVLPLFTYDYAYKEWLVGGYLNFDATFGKIETLVGLRAEYNDQASDKLNKNAFELFPSATIKYKINDDFFLSGHYSRRISRPPFFSMVPFYGKNSPYEIYVGTPSLKASLVNGFAFDTGYKQINLSFKYNRSKDAIYFLSTYDPSSGITYSRNDNIDFASVFSISLVVPIEITKWWSTFNNLIYYNSRYKDDGYAINKKVNTGMIRSGHSFSIGKTINLDLSARVLINPGGAKGSEKSDCMIDCAISKDFPKANLNITVSAEDVTGSQNRHTSKESYNNMLIESRDFFNSRTISLSLQYKFKGGKTFKTSQNKVSGDSESYRIE